MYHTSPGEPILQANAGLEPKGGIAKGTAASKLKDVRTAQDLRILPGTGFDS